jgi:FkbM family methyltransferase
VRYGLGNGVVIDVPLTRSDNCWDESEIQSYETDVITKMASAIGKMPAPVTFVDCGADIGLFSLRLASFCSLPELIAIEPDPEAYAWLEHNLRPVHGRTIHCAVADYTGKGRLAFPDYYPGAPHAQFLVPDERGSIPVTRIDDLGLGDGALALKIDVEGGELAVLKGASDAIRRARSVAIAFEAHPQVIERTGVDVIQCLEFLNQLRPFRSQVAETGRPIAPDDQFIVPKGAIWNILAVSL